MNCKPNDLAFITRPPKSMEEIRGRTVRVVTPGTGPKGCPIWSIEGRLEFVMVGNGTDSEGSKRYIGESVWLDQVEDGWLTPIRGEPGADETLQWAGKPEGVAA